MKYQKLNRSLHSFTHIFTTLRNSTPNTRVAEDTRARDHILDTVIKNLLILETEVKEGSDTWGKNPTKDYPCYEMANQSFLRPINAGVMCTTELRLFDEYKLFLRHAHKAFCHGVRTRSGGRKQGKSNKKNHNRGNRRKNQGALEKGKSSRKIDKALGIPGRRPIKNEMNVHKLSNKKYDRRNQHQKNLRGKISSKTKQKRLNQKPNKNQLTTV